MACDDPELDVLREQRDRPLTFHWRVAREDTIRSLGLPWSDWKRRAASDAIITEALLASDEGRWVSYSRTKGFYAGERRYRGTAYTYATVTTVVDELTRRGLLEEQRSSPHERGWQSRFRATSELLERLGYVAARFEPGEPIHLKDGNGDLVDYLDTEATRRMRREIQAINDALASIGLHLPGSDVVRTRHHLRVDGAFYRPTPPVLHRVFNGSFRLGGRAYGWWQSLPKARRRQLTMNGGPTAEPDFEQMHASILYAQRGLRLKGDAYATGEFPRALGKRAFFVALNTRTPQGTIAALTNKQDWPLSREETMRLSDALARRHKPIADDLHAGRGLDLMRVDSEIAIRATKLCIKAGIPVLPIHDSILTPRDFEARVAEIMEDSAAHVMRSTRPCYVIVSGPNDLQMPWGPSFPALVWLRPSFFRNRILSDSLRAFSIPRTPSFRPWLGSPIKLPVWRSYLGGIGALPGFDAVRPETRAAMDQLADAVRSRLARSDGLAAVAAASAASLATRSAAVSA